jgi:uncharacterized protein YcnI
MHKNLLPAGIAAFALACATPAASAHVTIDPAQAPAYSYVKATLRVSHGCKGSPTVRVRVRIPQGATSVRPQVKAPWQVEVTRGKQPVDDGHGGKITEAVTEVSWSGGRLSDEHFDEFAILMRVPDRPGTTLYFPVVQECEQGVLRWIEIPEAGKSPADYREPAPALRLTPAK